MPHYILENEKDYSGIGIHMTRSRYCLTIYRFGKRGYREKVPHGLIALNASWSRVPHKLRSAVIFQIYFPDSHIVLVALLTWGSFYQCAPWPLKSLG